MNKIWRNSRIPLPLANSVKAVVGDLDLHITFNDFVFILLGFAQVFRINEGIIKFV